MYNAIDMNWTFTIIISLVASIIGGVISGLVVMRKFAHDAKRVYARQIHGDFDDMSAMMFMSAREYLSSLGYEAEGLNAYKPSTKLKENLAIVNKIQDEYQKFYERKLDAYETQILVKQVGELSKYAIDEFPGVKNFLSRYILQSTYFDGLCDASSAVELLKVNEDQIPNSINDKQIRICVSNVTAYLLQLLTALLKAGAEIDYYSNAKQWTWRLFFPIGQKEGPTMSDEDKEAKVKKGWWTNLWSQLLLGLSQLFFGVALFGMVIYLLAQDKMEEFQSFELATLAGLLGGFPLVAAFADKREDETVRKRLKVIGGLYLLAAIFFIVFGFYQAGDQAGIRPSNGQGVWMYNAIYTTTFYGGAIALILGMWMSLELVPRLVGLGGIMDRVRIIFGKRNKVKRG